MEYSLLSLINLLKVGMWERKRKWWHSQKTPPTTRRWTGSIWKNHRTARRNDWHFKETRRIKVICKLLIMQFFYTSFKIHFMIVCKQITFLTHFIFPVSVNGKILLQQFQPIINTRFKSLLRWDQSEIEVRPNFESVRCEWGK